MQEIQDLKNLRDDLADKPTTAEALKASAVGDLRFLCSRVGYGLLNNVDYLALHDSNSKKLADILVFGYEKGGVKISFPERLLNTDGKMYAGVVLYDNNVVKDAYLFEGALFQKPGMFSIFKRKGGTCYVDVSNETKLKEYSFGNVIQKI